MFQALRRFFSNTQVQESPRRPVHRARPRLEALEDRLAPATCIFLGGFGAGEWSNPNNWLNGLVPVNPADSVVLDWRADNGTKPSKADIPGLTIGSLLVDSGYSATLTISETLTVQETVIQKAGRITVPAGQQFLGRDYELRGGTLDGSGGYLVHGIGEGGSGSFQVHENSTIGVAALTLDGNEFLVIDSSFSLNGAHIVNGGEIIWNTGNITCSNGASIDNFGVMSISTTNRTISNDGLTTPAVLNNYGTLDNQAGVTDISIAYNAKPGSTNKVNGGALALSGGTGESLFEVGAGAGLVYARDTTYQLKTGASFTGQGYVSVFGTLKLVGGASVSSDVAELRLTSTTISTATLMGENGTGTFSSSTQFVWNGGIVKDLSQLTISGNLWIQGNGAKTLQDTTLVNNAIAIWEGVGDITIQNAAIDNLNQLTISTDASMLRVGSGVLRNLAGATITRTSLGGTTIAVRLETQGPLELNGYDTTFLGGVFQSGASSVTYLGGATLTLGTATPQDQLFTLLGGVLKGGGAITGHLDNTGTGTVYVGEVLGATTLSVSGNYTQGEYGNLYVTVSWDQQVMGWVFGKLAVAGTATLAGELLFSLPDGAPPATTTGVILTANSLTQSLSEPQGWDLLQIGNSLAALKE